MSKKSEKNGAPFNPFAERNPDEVWKEIMVKGHSEGPLSREEVMQRLQKQANESKKRRAEK